MTKKTFMDFGSDWPMVYTYIYIILYDIFVVLPYFTVSYQYLINNLLEQMGSDLPQLNRHGICDVSTVTSWDSSDFSPSFRRISPQRPKLRDHR